MIELYAVKTSRHDGGTGRGRVEAQAALRNHLVKEVTTRLSDRFGIELEYGKDLHGRPFFLNFKDLRISVSHSGRWVVCAISSASVGVDIEEIRDFDFEGIVARFFAPQERGAVMGARGDQRLRHFYEIWTLKESYMKAVGLGLSLPMRSFWFDVRDEDAITLHSPRKREQFFFKHYTPARNYQISVCSEVDDFPTRMRYCRPVDDSVREPPPTMLNDNIAW